MSNKYLYISSRKYQKEYLKDNFNNIIFITKAPSKLTLNQIKREILNTDIKQVIIEDYFVGIQKFINQLNELELMVKIIWTKGLATLNEEIELGNLLEVVNLLKTGKIKSLAFTEENIYQVYKDLKGVKKLKLTLKGTVKYQKNNSNLIGVYGDPYNWQSNLFNQLSAIKLIDNRDAFVVNCKNIVDRFCKFFDIKHNKLKKKFNVQSFRKSIKNISVATCVEFSNLYDLFVIDSFNNGIPVVVGNNSLFFKGTELENIVTVRSDDDINEIASKINYCLNNSKDIIDLYKKIKQDYDQGCKNLMNDFIKE